jgi:hypothetical protein
VIDSVASINVLTAGVWIIAGGFFRNTPGTTETFVARLWDGWQLVLIAVVLVGLNAIIRQTENRG